MKKNWRIIKTVEKPKKRYKLIATDLGKQQKLDADPKVTPTYQFYWKSRNIATIFFIMEKAQETALDFSKEIV